MDSTKTEKEKGHGPGSHNSVEIEGVSWPPLVSKESLKAIKNFDVRNDDVWIASYPKAGQFLFMGVAGRGGCLFWNSFRMAPPQFHSK